MLVGSVRSSRSHNLRPSIRPSGPNLSRALNLHLSGSGLLDLDVSELLGQTEPKILGLVMLGLYVYVSQGELNTQ